MRCRSSAVQKGQGAQQKLPLHAQPGAALPDLGLLMIEQCLQVLQQNSLAQADSRRQSRRKDELAFGDQG